jgi:hypothetical protein
MAAGNTVDSDDVGDGGDDDVGSLLWWRVWCLRK